MGHKWLKEEFGVKPRVGWNIDPFGHTETNAAIFADLGFEALFFGRAGQDEINERFKPENHEAHFLWRPMAKHHGSQKQILGGFFTKKETYSLPDGFKYDERSNENNPI